MDAISTRTGWRALGLVPYFADAARLPAEDALALPSLVGKRGGGGARIVVLAYPRISNFDDLDPLRLEPGVDVRFLRPGEPIQGNADLVILPGSKATIADLEALRGCGWDIDLAGHVRRGGRVLGICGGFQMLGRRIADPDGSEGPPGAVEGLGLLDIETRLGGDKVLGNVRGVSVETGVSFKGYEMHIGRTWGPGCGRPLLRFEDGRVDGAVGDGGRVAGCYVHGLFSDDAQRGAWLAVLDARRVGFDYEAEVEAILDRLAAHLEAHVACDALLGLAREPRFMLPD